MSTRGYRGLWTAANSQSRWMSQYISVGWATVTGPVWTVSAISPPCIETEAGDDQKDVSASRVNRDPVSWTVLPIFPKLVRRARGLQLPNRV
jgi:hypothetical protein